MNADLPRHRNAGGVPVYGAPPGEISLDRHRAGDTQHDLDPTRTFEGLVREVAVEPDGDAQSTDQVHAREQAQVEQVEPVAPGKPHDGDQCQWWQDDRDQDDHPGATLHGDVFFIRMVQGGLHKRVPKKHSKPFILTCF